ncbi:uncharacterized protein MICPUCDRAFT_11360, partial [Micromonas pusilla CCMP1545]
RNVFLYVPNLIGYARVALTIASLLTAFSRVEFSLAAYFLSFVCDELDGRFARMFDQCSEYGATLDMVTDRLSTTGLLMVVAAEVPTLFYPCVGLVMLDIASHWVHVHASSLRPGGKKSHKDVADSRYFLLRLYYSNRAFMGVCCVSCEVFLGAFDTVAKQLCVAALPGFAMKQFANWCQLMGSSRALA